jgi:sulfur carrier protein
MIFVSVNGERAEFADGCTVAGMLSRLAIGGRFAVEVNERLVTRGEHARFELHDGDRVEIVRAVGGG